MNITLKEGINFNSIGLRHDAVLQAVTLIEGRESALHSEKEIYTVISVMDKVCNNGIIEYCNASEEDLMTIYRNEIEPAFLDLISQNESAEHFYYSVLCDVEEYCTRVYEEQHSIIGFVNSLANAIQSLSPDQLQDVMVKTGEIAGRLKEQHDHRIEEQNIFYKQKIVDTQEEINSSIQQLMDKYNIKTEDTE